MSNTLLDARHYSPQEQMIWPAHLVRAEEISTALARARLGEPGPDGRREMMAVHPCSREPGLGLAPATSVAFGVVKPGEATRRRRTNAGSFAMALTGKAVVHVGPVSHEVSSRDCWNTPGMHVESMINTGEDDFTYVVFSNAPYLRKLEAYFEEFDPPAGELAHSQSQARVQIATMVERAKDIAGAGIELNDTGAQLLPYEHLIDPEFAPSRSLLWRWLEVAEHLGLVRSLQQGYNGRPLWALYNPATGTRNGTTFSFFATITSAAPNMVGPAHRHMSSAINFILEGSGWSVVNSERVEWAAGDIMLSAPGWAPHGHATGPDGAVILTIQDHPLHIGTESLIWQEDLKNGPILSLGSEPGFETNLAQMRAGQ